MGDYRSPGRGSQPNTPALNLRLFDNRLLFRVQLTHTRGAETIARQQHHLSSSAIPCAIPAYVSLRNALIPFRHQFHTQHVLDTFPLTNHSPLTVGSSSTGRCLKFHNPTCEVCPGPFAARSISIGCFERSVP